MVDACTEYQRLFNIFSFQMTQRNAQPAFRICPQRRSTVVNLLPLLLLQLLLYPVQSAVSTKCPTQCICVPKGMSCEKPGLKSLPPPHSPQLEYLLIENQTLESSHLGPTELSMYTSRDYGGSVQLKNLYIRACNIESIGRYAFQSLGPQLEMIDLTGNPLRHIGDYAFAGLEQLTLVLDEIEQPEFSRHTFVGLVKLKSLTIQNAKLTTLPFEPLQQLTSEGKLEKLRLRGNRLQMLDSKYDQIFKHLQSFDIRDNPWHCDCQLNWLIRRYRTILIDQQARKGNRNQPDAVQGPISTPWELEGRQPRCASPVAVMGRNFTSLITDMEQIYGRPPLTTSATIPSVLYCSPPRLTQLTVDLSDVLSSPHNEDEAESSHSREKSNTDSRGAPNVKLKCTVKGSRQLLLRWFYHDSQSGIRVIGNHSRPKIPHSDAILSKEQWSLTTNDQYTSENDLEVFKTNRDVDTYSCLAQDVIGNISTSVRIKWPPVPPISSLPDKHNPKNNKSVTGVYSNNWKLAESSMTGSYSVLHAPQFSLSDLLWAVVGTFFSTLILFFIIYKTLHSPLSNCTKQKSYKLELRTSDSLAIVPGDSSLSNSSPSNIKLTSGLQTTLSDLATGNSVSVQYNNPAGMLPVANSLLPGHTYHLLNGAPVFSHQTLPLRGANNNHHNNNRAMHHEGIPGAEMNCLPARSMVPTDSTISSTSAYEPVVYADANCAHSGLVNYDMPGFSSAGLANMRLYNEQQIPLLFNNYVLDLNRSVVGRPAEFIPSVMRIPPPPATPQPSLPESINSLHPVHGLEPGAQSHSLQASASQLSTNLLMMQAGYPSMQHDSAFSETISG